MSANSSALGQLLWRGPVCSSWKQDMEGAVYHLASCFMLMGFMAGSGVYGCFYLFGILGPGYLCCVLWGWFGACGLDIVLWNFLLTAACLLQLAHLVYRLRVNTLPEEFNLLYQTLCLPLQVPLQVYKEIVQCCHEQVLTLATEQTYAVEGETPINRLSLLLSGRVRVSQDGQFLHYIFPYQFMDSPEWESLHPSEEGTFQVTLTAETECSYISWPRKNLHLLLNRERYISRLFAALLGYDISEKLYTLNDKLFAKFGLRFDIRLPSLYHVLGSSASDGGPESEKDDEEVFEAAVSPAQARPICILPTPPCSPPPAANNFPASLPRARMSRPDSGPLGEDSTSLVLEDFEEVSGSESFMDYRSDGEYMSFQNSPELFSGYDQSTGPFGSTPHSRALRITETMASLPHVSRLCSPDGHLYSHLSSHPSERSGGKMGKWTCHTGPTTAPRVTGGNLPSGTFLTGGGSRAFRPDSIFYGL